MKTAKGTKCEQKFQKPKNENICLTNLNMANNGNFHFLSFGDEIRTMLKVEILNLIVGLTIRFNYDNSWRIIVKKWAFLGCNT